MDKLDKMKPFKERNGKTQSELQERVKELSCLYNITRLGAQTDAGIDEILDAIVECLPPAWLYLHKACARIVLDRRPHSTPNFRREKYRQQEKIIVNGKRRGYIEIAYPDEDLSFKCNPFLEEEQRLLKTVAVEVATIIVRRETEREKSRLEEQLRHADRLATVGQLAAGIAHELNEPLAHILGFAQLIQKYPDLPPQVQADIGKILDTSLHARDIVRRLLVFAREIPPQKIKVNLNNLIKENLPFFETRCVKNGVRITCTLSPNIPYIEADPSQLNQVLVNLIVNALHSMPAGGKLSVSTRKRQSKVCLSIEDTGIGMDKNVLKKIFIPFFTTKDVGLGTGLGLPVVHGIIASHGGSIDIESQVGKGTVCRIELPIGKKNYLEKQTDN